MIYFSKVGEEGGEFKGWWFANIRLYKGRSVCGIKKTRIGAFLAAMHCMFLLARNKILG